MLKKACIVSANNLYLVPYIKNYIPLLPCEYDIVYWNRHNSDKQEQEHCGEKELYVYNHFVEDNMPKIGKLKKHLSFAGFAKKIIKQNKYSLIILLHSNMAVLLISPLLKYYKHKYIFDIRDYTLEKNKVFYLLEKKLTDNSKLNVISSDGYKKFLPESKYITVHNEYYIQNDIINQFRNQNKTVCDRMVLTFIGFIRYHDQNIKIINIFKNDKRFELRFIGKGASFLSEYCRVNNVQNIVIHDRFPPEETLKYLEGTACILNLYGNNNPGLDYALSNKLYYAAKLGMPILVCPDTYMEEISTEYGFGFSFDLNDVHSKENLWEYYHNIEWNDFYNKCDNFLNDVSKDQKLFEESIANIFKE